MLLQCQYHKVVLEIFYKNRGRTTIMDSLNKDQMLSVITKTFEDRIPFNKLLGFDIEINSNNSIQLAFKMHPDLIGNFLRGSLHGGVISSSLDVVGGLAAFLGFFDENPIQSLDEGAKFLSRLGTVDLRVDYLRPGLGKSFYATSSVMRTGNRIAVSRMELRNDSDALIAIGTGTYSIG